MASCPSGMSVDDCNAIHNAATISPTALYNLTYGAPPAPVTASIDVLPPNVQTAVTGCTAPGCKAIAHDFTNLSNTPQVVTNLPYIYKTNQTTLEDKAVIDPNRGTYLSYSQLPGYEFNSQAFMHANMRAGGFVHVEYPNVPTTGNSLQKCFETCDAGSDCAGFNFVSSVGTCEFFPTGLASTPREDLNTDRQLPYNRWTSSYDSATPGVSYAKREPPPLNKNDTVPTAIDISGTGRFCNDFTACNTAMDTIIEGGQLQRFTTSELDACSGCPTRKFRTDGTTFTVTSELSLSKNYTSKSAAKTGMHYGTGAGASHSLTMPFPKDKLVTVKKVDGTSLFTNFNSNVNGLSNVSITTAPWLDTSGLARTIIYQPVDFVTNGFLIMDGKTYTFYSAAQNAFGRMTDPKYSPGYVSNVYLMS